jgi:hypothetical protein
MATMGEIALLRAMFEKEPGAEACATSAMKSQANIPMTISTRTIVARAR